MLQASTPQKFAQNHGSTTLLEIDTYVDLP